MRRAFGSFVAVLVVLAICLCFAVATCLPVQAQESGVGQEAAQVDFADGDYTVEVSLAGGSGRASVESPAAMVVRLGKATLTLVWSSPNYDYMVVGGKRYLPVNQTGNSTFEIPVLSLDKPFKVVGDTTAMSTPHEIEYELTLRRDSIREAAKRRVPHAHVALIAALVLVLAFALIWLWFAFVRRRPEDKGQV